MSSATVLLRTLRISFGISIHAFQNITFVTNQWWNVFLKPAKLSFVQSCEKKKKKKKKVLKKKKTVSVYLPGIDFVYFLPGSSFCKFSEEWILLVDLLPFCQGRQLLWHFLFAFLQPSSFWKEVYFKRKEFALRGSKFLPFRVDPFSEGRICKLPHFKVYQLALRTDAKHIL